MRRGERITRILAGASAGDAGTELPDDQLTERRGRLEAARLVSSRAPTPLACEQPLLRLPTARRFHPRGPSQPR